MELAGVNPFRSLSLFVPPGLTENHAPFPSDKSLGYFQLSLRDKNLKPMSETFQYISSNEETTETLGQALAATMIPGTVVALVGNLGAGKTRLVQSIVSAMGIDRREVTSPTFVLIQEYEARLPVYHFDTYRLRDSDDFLELGADELMASEGICFIEWADRVADVLPTDLLKIEIDITGETSRVFQFSGSGQRSDEVISRLMQSLDAD